MKLDNEIAAHWFKLPMKLRRRWWNETDYGAKAPSDDLKQAVLDAIESIVRPPPAAA